MPRDITKGMILAAGLGTRLRPLTNSVPKPLIEIGGRRLIEYCLATLVKAGIREIVINLHHLGEQISTFLGDGSRYGASITYSHEPEILGTGGGIKKVEAFFNGRPFVVMNGDVIIKVDLKDVIKTHIRNKTEATLVLRRLAEGEMYTPIKIQNGYIVGFGMGDMMYTGLQVIEPSVLSRLSKDTFSDIVTGAYIPIIKGGGRVGGYVSEDFWIDIGTKERLDNARSIFDNNNVEI